MFDPKRINVASFSMHWECCHNGSVCLPLLGLHFTLWAWHDEIVAHEMPFDGKTDAFCFKKMRQVSNFFFPISLFTVNSCWGRCEPQCILVSLSFKKPLWGSQCQCHRDISGNLCAIVGPTIDTISMTWRDRGTKDAFWQKNGSLLFQKDASGFKFLFPPSLFSQSIPAWGDVNRNAY